MFSVEKRTCYHEISSKLFWVVFFLIGFLLGMTQAQKVYIEVPHIVKSNSQPIVVTGITNATTTFRAHIVRGASFQKEIGNDLVFVLTPNENGWDANVASIHSNENNYKFASVATPPFHGDTPLKIEGWNFRNKNNTAANDGSVNAYQKIRSFSFVLNKNDANTIGNVIAEYSSGRTKDFSPNVPMGQGVLTIKNLELGNLNKDSIAWITSMDFDVDIRIPDNPKP